MVSSYEYIYLYFPENKEEIYNLYPTYKLETFNFNNRFLQICFNIISQEITTMLLIDFLTEYFCILGYDKFWSLFTLIINPPDNNMKYFITLQQIPIWLECYGNYLYNYDINTKEYNNALRILILNIRCNSYCINNLIILISNNNNILYNNKEIKYIKKGNNKINFQ